MDQERTAIQVRYDKLGPRVAEALQRRHFDAYYFQTSKEAVEHFFTLIPKDHVVSWGGSETIQGLELPKKLRERGYQVIDRDEAKDIEERFDIMRKALLCDTFLMSSNAITEDGQLFNIDGNGNRVAAMAFGPKSIIVVAGMNKVVKTHTDAVARVRNLAAPTRAQCFPGIQTPCTANGACADCVSPDCICAYMVTTRISRPAHKIKVILVGEDLGF